MECKLSQFLCPNMWIIYAMCRLKLFLWHITGELTIFDNILSDCILCMSLSRLRKSVKLIIENRFITTNANIEGIV